MDNLRKKPKKKKKKKKNTLTSKKIKKKLKKIDKIRRELDTFCQFSADFFDFLFVLVYTTPLWKGVYSKRKDFPPKERTFSPFQKGS